VKVIPHSDNSLSTRDNHRRIQAAAVGQHDLFDGGQITVVIRILLQVMKFRIHSTGRLFLRQIARQEINQSVDVSVSTINGGSRRITFGPALISRNPAL